MILLVSAMILAGCTGSAPAPGATPVTVPVTTVATGTPVPAQTAVLTTVPVTITAVRTTVQMTELTHAYSKTYSFEGTGDYTQEFTTDRDGTWVFRMNYPGEEVFIATIKDRNGDDVEVLANEGGSYTGTKSVQLVAGKYYLDVAAAAPWTITMSTG